MRIRETLRAIRHAVVAVLLTLLLTIALVGGLAGTANAAPACGPVVEKYIGSQSYRLVAARFSGGGFYHFRYTTVQRSPAVMTWVNNAYAATYTSFPVSFSSGTVYVYLKQVQVLETYSGQPRYVTKYLPYVRACSNLWSVV